MQSGDSHGVDGMELAASAGDPPPRLDARVTLVLTRSATADPAANVAVTRLDSGPVEYVSSFSVACQLIIANRVSQVVVLETASRELDKFEVRVLMALAKDTPLVRLRVPEWRSLQTAPPARHDERHAAAEPAADEVQVGRLRVRRCARNFCVGDIYVPITSTESELLWMLATRGVTSEASLRLAFKNPEAPTIGSVVRQYIHRLRRKLELSGRAASIVSVRGGYGLVPHPDQTSDETPGHQISPVTTAA